VSADQTCAPRRRQTTVAAATERAIASRNANREPVGSSGTELARVLLGGGLDPAEAPEDAVGAVPSVPLGGFDGTTGTADAVGWAGPGPMPGLCGLDATATGTVPETDGVATLTG